MPHTSRITISGTTFTQIFFGVSKKWVRSSSHASKVTDLTTFAKKLLVVRPKTALRIRKEKIAIVKRFALHANAISSSILGYNK